MKINPHVAGAVTAVVLATAGAHAYSVERMQSQACRPEPIAADGTGTGYWITVNGVDRSHHRMDKAFVFAGDSLAQNPTADVEVLGRFRMEWRGYDGRPCSPDVTAPDTTASVAPVSSVTVAGYAWPDMLHAIQSGVELNWDSAPADSFIVTGGRASDNEWTSTVVGAGRTFRMPLPYTNVTPVQVCVARVVGGAVAEKVCDSMNWAPMVSQGYSLVITQGSETPAPGDSLRMRLSKSDGSWAADTASRPDSIIFTADAPAFNSLSVHTERIYTYDFPGTDTTAFVVPNVDSLFVFWTAYRGGGVVGGGKVFEVSP